MVEVVQTVEPGVVKRLVQLELEAFGPGGMNEWHLVPMIRHGRVYVVKRKQEIVGVIEYMLDWENPRMAYLVGISISQEVRGQGIGTELIRESIKALAREKIEEIELTVDPANVVAVSLYKNKFGFMVTELRANEYGQGEDRLVMQLVFPR